MTSGLRGKLLIANIFSISRHTRHAEMNIAQRVCIGPWRPCGDFSGLSGLGQKFFRYFHILMNGQQHQVDQGFQTLHRSFSV
jgi:hypothetical protein